MGASILPGASMRADIAARLRRAIMGSYLQEGLTGVSGVTGGSGYASNPSIRQLRPLRLENGNGEKRAGVRFI